MSTLVVYPTAPFPSGDLLVGPESGPVVSVGMFPLAPDPATGVPKPIAAPNYIDPSILPASSSAMPVNIPASTTFTVAANTQQFFHIGLEVDGALHVDGYLIGV